MARQNAVKSRRSNPAVIGNLLERAVSIGLALIVLSPNVSAQERASSAKRDGPENDKPSTLSLITYNVHGIWIPDPNNLFATRKGRFRKIAPSLNDYDIALLQEFFGVRRRRGKERDRYQRHLLNGALHAKKVVAAGPLGADYDSGLANLSNKQVGASYLENYNACSGYWNIFKGNDCRSKKGFFLTRLPHQGKEIHVYTTHLDSGGFGGDRKARRSQMKQLQEYITKHSVGHAVILAGDFNTKLDSKPNSTDAIRLEQLRADLDLTNACPKGSNCDNSSCPKWGLCSKKRIDYVFYRSSDDLELKLVERRWLNFRSNGKSGKRLSDHPALAVKFSIPPKTD